MKSVNIVIESKKYLIYSLNKLKKMLKDLMKGLDLEIANDINKKKLGVLPDVPTYQFPAAPVPEVNEDDELARQLELL